MENPFNSTQHSGSYEQTIATLITKNTTYADKVFIANYDGDVIQRLYPVNDTDEKGLSKTEVVVLPLSIVKSLLSGYLLYQTVETPLGAPRLGDEASL